ncbi:cyclase family protein [Pseudorhodoferax sp.]|uniref:cyclase family protein n=1 Tax=Pseudorhodoferax sp. TaxID=1993553 RepID=UPI002DD62A08|nr:cyclase family protein [Pseudorhodoferax sp.]
MSTSNPRWTHRPDGSNWGDFGPDDQLGRANLLTPEQVLKGVREVRSGRSFCLSLPLDLPGGNLLNPRRHPPRLAATTKDDVPYMNFAMHHIDPDAVDVLSDDQVLLALQYSTQWDSLAHMGAWFDVLGDGQARKVYYNGYRAGEHVLGGSEAGAPNDDGHDGCTHGLGAHRLGIENLAVKTMQGRGVLVDFVPHHGHGRTLIGHDALQRVLDHDGITIEPGDMLVLRTGFADVVVDHAGRASAELLHASGAVLDGADEKLLQWISDSGIACICADNYAVEAYPARPRTGPKSLLPLHHHCLFKLGLPLAELWYLRELAEHLHAEGRHRFLLTAPPLRLPGAVGSPVTPVATV